MKQELGREGKEDKVNETEFKQIVGSLRYLCHSRPDLEFAIGLVSRYTKRPRIPHLLAAKRILRFIKGTINTGILFPNKDNNNSEELVGYTDANWGGDRDDRKSTIGYIFMYGATPISWSSKKQSIVALSTCEAKYVPATMSACQAVSLDTLLQELKIKESDGVKLFVDNK